MTPAPTDALAHAVQPQPALPPGLAFRTTLRDLRAGEADRGPLDDQVADLRSATMRYARSLREAGARPERMLPEVKGLVRAAMSAEGWSDPEATDAIMARVVKWSVEAYYDVTVAR